MVSIFNIFKCKLTRKLRAVRCVLNEAILLSQFMCIISKGNLLLYLFKNKNKIVFTDNGASVEGDISLETELPEALQESHVEKVITYTLNKLMSGEPHAIDPVCSLRIFYPVSQQLIIQHVCNILSKLSDSLPVSYTLVPVMQLHNLNTVLSVSALRHN